MKLKKQELMHAISTLYTALTQGQDDEEAAAELGMDLEEIRNLKSQMMDFKTDELKSKPIEHVYVEYVINQMVNLNDLTEMIKIYRGDPKASNAAVGAIRTRSEILDKILNKGQDCGVIQKAPSRTESLFGILISDLTNEKLNDLLNDKMRELKTLANENTVNDILDIPVPVDLYDGPMLEMAEVEVEDEPPPKLVKKKKKIRKKKVKKTKVKKRLEAENL